MRNHSDKIETHSMKQLDYTLQNCHHHEKQRKAKELLQNKYLPVQKSPSLVQNTVWCHMLPWTEGQILGPTGKIWILNACAMCSAHGISQARILEWAVMPSLQGIFLTQPATLACTAGGFLTAETVGKPYCTHTG